jgi:hypothetical protein
MPLGSLETGILVSLHVPSMRLDLTLVGLSRQFAFCRFSTVSSSTAFLERNYPHIYLNDPEYDGPGRYNAGEVKVRIAFSRERDDRDRPSRGEDEWKCRAVCCIAV